MAYIDESQTAGLSTDQNRQAQPGQPPSLGAGGAGGLFGSGASASIGGRAPVGESGSGGPPQSNTSGQWTNLNNYLNANSDQAGTIGQTVGNQVGNSAQAAQLGLNTAQTGFENQAPYQAIGQAYNGGNYQQNIA